MAVEKITLAQPYGKAAFEHAVSSNSLGGWHSVLNTVTVVAEDQRVIEALQNPTVAKSNVLNIFLDVCEKISNEAQQNFLRILAEEDRLSLLPEITKVFAAKRAEYEKTVEVHVSSFLPLDAENEQKIAAAMKRRLQREVSIHVTVDPSLLGGAVIRAGDEVIDGSVKYKLAKLEQALVA